eukprot:TRINITY_DN78715_c0_g1_i1.p1 TRINITY_DN78715_c0_g1~~TRINITY_DN78715_c0_g1_i1.p1  ORF type:complete len:726 (+),score=102.68 TRINITY_DN78715_c0_g1_i1:32-2209(+)
MASRARSPKRINSAEFDYDYSRASVSSEESEEDYTQALCGSFCEEGDIHLGLGEASAYAEYRRGQFRCDMAKLDEVASRADEDQSWSTWYDLVQKISAVEFIELLGAMSAIRNWDAAAILRNFTRQVPDDVMHGLRAVGEGLDKASSFEEPSQKEIKFMLEALVRDGENYVYPFQIFKYEQVVVCATKDEVERMPHEFCRKKQFQKRGRLKGMHLALQRWLSGSFNTITEVQVVYTPAQRLFLATTSEKALIVRALAICYVTGQSSVFTAPLGIALVTHVWYKETLLYTVDILQELVQLFCLAWACFYLRRNMSPTILNFTVLSIISLRMTGNILIQFFTSLWLLWKMKADELKAAIDLLFSLRGAMIFMEGFSCTVILWIAHGLVSSRLDDEQNVFLARATCSGEHTGTGFCKALRNQDFFAMMILFRWFHLVLQLMGVRAIGENVLPAISAATRTESVFFMLFLSAMVIGSFHAYYSFAIDENVFQGDLSASSWWRSSGWYPVLNTFLKMYRLNVMGDFDLYELEGVDDTVSGHIFGNLTGDRIAAFVDGTVDEGDEVEISAGIRFFFMLISLVVHIVFMNVYIGLLSTLYEDAKAKKHELYYKHLADKTYDYLMRRSFWERWRCCRSLDNQNADSADSPVWMIVQKSAVASDQDGGADQMQTTLQNIHRHVDARLDNFEAKMQRQMDEIKAILRASQAVPMNQAVPMSQAVPMQRAPMVPRP